MSNVRKMDTPSAAGKAEPVRSQPLKSLSTTAQLRERARQSIGDGAVTPGYRANREKVIELLNHALATEMVCVLRYLHHYYMAEGLPAEAIKKEFKAHAVEEQQHADWLAERIVQLGGDPNFDPAGIVERSHAEYGTGKTLIEMLRDDLIAERIAIESYSEAIAYINDDDPTTKRLLERILSAEEEHAEEIASMLANLNQWKNSSK